MILSVAILAELVLLAVASRFGDFTVPGHATHFVVLMWGAAAFFLIALAQFARSATRWSTLSGEQIFFPYPALVFWGTAFVLRIAMLGCAPADDMWRYIWEGQVQLHGINPYVESPDSPALLPLRTEHWARINHRESPAIYPPAAELIFRGLAQARPSVSLFKLVFIAADLLTALLLVHLCRTTCERDDRRTDSRAQIKLPVRGARELACDGRVRAYKDVAWYAWNPAVVYAFAGAGHYDSLMLVALTAALAILYRAHPQESCSCQTFPHMRKSLGAAAWASAACLGVAIALKIVPVFLLPAVICALRSRSIALVVSAAIPLALSQFYGGISVVLGPLKTFADVTRFHDLFWWLLEAAIAPNPYQRNWPFTVVLAVACAIVTFKFRRDWRRCALWLFGVVLVLSPVLHPWYTIWILPLAVWHRAHAWTVLSLSSLAALLLWDTTPWWTAWEPNLLTRALVILPPLAAWFFQLKIEGPTTSSASPHLVADGKIHGGSASGMCDSIENRRV
jgi:hypothetical protein